MRNAIRIAIIAVFSLTSTACVGAVVGAATDVVVETAKVPFKVGGAVVDVATPDRKKKKNDDSE